MHQYAARPYCSEWWEWCEPVRVGLLVDMDRGCVTCRINGRYNTPCVRFPTFGWDPLGNGEDPRGASKLPLDKHSKYYFDIRYGVL